VLESVADGHPVARQRGVRGVEQRAVDARGHHALQLLARVRTHRLVLEILCGSDQRGELVKHRVLVVSAAYEIDKDLLFQKHVHDGVDLADYVVDLTRTGPLF